jgi:hypothetical protein
MHLTGSVDAVRIDRATSSLGFGLEINPLDSNPSRTVSGYRKLHHIALAPAQDIPTEGREN